jgi:hypothetical protein
MLGYVLAFLASLGGLWGIAILLAKGVITGTISHLWKKRLHRRHEGKDQR